MPHWSVFASATCSWRVRSGDDDWVYLLEDAQAHGASSSYSNHRQRKERSKSTLILAQWWSVSLCIGAVYWTKHWNLWRRCQHNVQSHAFDSFIWFAEFMGIPSTTQRKLWVLGEKTHWNPLRKCQHNVITRFSDSLIWRCRNYGNTLYYTNIALLFIYLLSFLRQCIWLKTNDYSKMGNFLGVSII